MIPVLLTKEELQKKQGASGPTGLNGDARKLGLTGPHGLGLADYEHPVFDGPQPGDKRKPLRNLNTEGDE